LFKPATPPASGKSRFFGFLDPPLGRDQAFDRSHDNFGRVFEERTWRSSYAEPMFREARQRLKNEAS